MLFEVIEKNFDSLGINSTQAEKSNPINKRIFVGFIVLFFNALLQLLFVINEAHGFQEYIESIYMTSIAIISFLILVTIILKIECFFGYMEMVNDVLIEIKNDKGNVL